MMLRNMPNKYTQKTLLQEINDCGFAGTWDFFHLPHDAHTRSNSGYAFINFPDPADAARFREAFANYRFVRHKTRKAASVSTAYVQGLYDNLRHFEHRVPTGRRCEHMQPIVLHGKVRVEFRDAVEGAKERQALLDSEATRAAAATKAAGMTLGAAAAAKAKASEEVPKKPQQKQQWEREAQNAPHQAAAWSATSWHSIANHKGNFAGATPKQATSNYLDHFFDACAPTSVQLQLGETLPLVAYAADPMGVESILAGDMSFIGGDKVHGAGIAHARQGLEAAIRDLLCGAAEGDGKSQRPTQGIHPGWGLHRAAWHGANMATVPPPGL